MPKNTKRIANSPNADVETHNTSVAQGIVNFVDRLTEIVCDTKRRLKRSIEDLYYVGLNLIEAKGLLGHGKFVSWLKEELNIDRKTAERFINVTKMFQGKCGNLSHLGETECDIMSHLDLTPTILYEIASPSTPEGARSEILDRALVGEKISLIVAKKIVSQHKTVLRPNVVPKIDKFDDWTTISDEHPHFGGQKCKVKYEVSRGNQLCELQDGTTIAISDQFLHSSPTPTILQRQAFTQADIDIIKEQHKAELKRIEEDYSVVTASLKVAAPVELQQEYAELQESYKSLKEENTRLQLQVEELQSLRFLETENQQLRAEGLRLANAAAEVPSQRWNQNFNAEAAKVVIAAAMIEYPPELNLRAIALNPPSEELRPEALRLLGQALGHLVPLGLSEYRKVLQTAQTWQEVQPITEYWIALKSNIWAELSQAEKIRIHGLIDESEREFPIGSRVKSKCDRFEAEYGLTGEVIGFALKDFRVRWQRPNGCFEKRHSVEEIELIKEEIACA